MALVSGSPEMSLLVRNRVGSNPTLISIPFCQFQEPVSLVTSVLIVLLSVTFSFVAVCMENLRGGLEAWRRPTRHADHLSQTATSTNSSSDLQYHHVHKPISFRRPLSPCTLYRQHVFPPLGSMLIQLRGIVPALIGLRSSLITSNQFPACFIYNEHFIASK
jgi:hypothetical protein